MVTYLPAESALARVRGWWWTEQHEMAAVLAELGHAHMVATYAVGGAKKSQLPAPLRIPRPVFDVAPEPVEAEEERPPKMTRASIRSTLLAG